MFRKTKRTVSREKIASYVQEGMALKLLNSDTQLSRRWQMHFPGLLTTLMAI